jgi:beta-lactamase class A
MTSFPPNRFLLPRRELLFGLGALAVSCAPISRSPAAPPVPARDSLADLERRVGGRIGVCAVDTANERGVAHRADERFAMCSTFKWLLAAAVLARLDRGELALDERVPFGERDLVGHAPATRARVADGAMTIDDLARAAVTVSDNTAANLLLARIGGPAALTALARAAGDDVTHLDRDEPGLNTNLPGDPRDTTSPRAMVGTMRRILVGDVLGRESRERLTGWLRACETGRDRLRAGFPATWAVGDKTGTGERGAVNDVAIAWPPGRPPVLVAAYMSDGHADAAAQAEVGRLVAAALTAT